MANRNLDISALDAVGVYVIEIDGSVPPIEVDSQRTRIIAGFSKKGPKNTLVYLRTKQDAVNVFGEIDTYLERRGSYFHRSLLSALEGGPVFALNLLPVNNDLENGDKVEFVSYSLDSNASNGYKNAQGTTLSYLYSSFFNQERFWKPNGQYFQSVVDNFALSQGKYFSIVNLGTTPMTIIARKATNVPRDFQLTVNEFYGTGKEPLIAKPFDLVSDYFVDIMVIEGRWDDFQKLSADPVYGDYFDTKGLRKDRINEFMSSDGVRLVANFTGSVLPELLANDGTNYSIDTTVNNQFAQTGIFCTLNEKAIEEYDPAFSSNHIDLIGHNIVSGDVNRVNYLSYNEIIDAVATVDQNTDIFNFESLGVANITANDLGYEIDKLSTSQVDVFTNIYIESLKTDLDLSGVSFSNEALYMNFGSDLWAYGNADNGKVTAITGKNDGILKFQKDVYPMFETALRVTLDGSDYKVKFSKAELLEMNPGLSTAAWLNALPTVGLLDVYMFNGNEMVKIGYSGFTANEYLVSDDTEYELTLTDVNIDTVPVTDASIDIVIEPMVVANIDLYAQRMDAVIEDATNNSLYIGQFNAKYTDVSNLTYDTIKNNQINKNVTVDKFIINDQGMSYSLVREVQLDNTIVLSDDLAVAEQGEEILFDGTSIKLDLVDARTIYSDHDVLRIGAAGDTVFVSSSVGENLNVGDYVVGIYNDEKVLTTITDKVRFISDIDGTIEYEITTILAMSVESNKIRKYSSVDEFSTHLNPQSLGGFTFTSYHIPDGTDEQMTKIYNVLDPANSNLRSILADKNIVDWRYIVDTFSGGIAPNMGGKSQLSKLAAEKKQGIALLNAPSMQQFADSTNPYFTEQPSATVLKPILNTDYIRSGGNLSMGPSNRFSIPNEANGGKHTGVFGPYLAIAENGRRKIIPPAADVSNNYMTKFRLGQPYAIVAGEPLGIIGNSQLVGVEYDLLNKDRANFEKIGINPIVFRDGTTKIFANLTGYQRTVTPLNSLHVRDLLISIENTLINITSKYLFKKNTPAVRLEIQTIVETYLESVLTDGGINWFKVTIDGSNNTNDIINQRIALLDIEVEPALGMEKFVNRITVYGAGGSTASGF